MSRRSPDAREHGHGKGKGQRSLSPITLADIHFQVGLDFRTEQGQPLGGVRASRRARGSRTYDFRPGNFPPDDPRHAYPNAVVNHTTSAEIRHDNPLLFNALQWLNHMYFNGHPPTEGPTARQMYEMGAIGMWLPSYLVFRADKSLNRNRLPVELHHLYQTSVGVRSASGQLMAIHPSTEYLPVNTEQLFNAAGDTRIHGHPALVRMPQTPDEPVTACPEGKNRITHTLGMLIDQTQGDHNASILNQHIAPDEYDRVKAFCILADRAERQFSLREIEIDRLSQLEVVGEQAIKRNVILTRLRRERQDMQRDVLIQLNQLLGLPTTPLRRR